MTNKIAMTAELVSGLNKTSSKNKKWVSLTPHEKTNIEKIKRKFIRKEKIAKALHLPTAKKYTRTIAAIDTLLSSACVCEGVF